MLSGTPTTASRNGGGAQRFLAARLGNHAVYESKLHFGFCKTRKSRQQTQQLNPKPLQIDRLAQASAASGQHPQPAL